MRIAVSGTANIGKTTVIRDFLAGWPSYQFENYTYRDKLIEEGLDHSSKTNKKVQSLILKDMVTNLKKYSKSDNVIFDRCPLDNIVYSLWSLGKQDSDIDEKFIDKCLPIVKEAMRNLDIIFFIPMTKHQNIDIVEDGTRETDPVYIKEIDNFFKVAQRHYHENPQENPFFPHEDSPAMIEIFGSELERIQMIKLYVDAEGDLIGGDGGSEIFSPENLDMMEQLLEDQKLAKDDEAELKKTLENIKEMNKDFNS